MKGGGWGEGPGGLAAIMCPPPPPNWTEVGAAGQSLGVAVATRANVSGGAVAPRMFQIPLRNPQPFGRRDSAAERRRSGSGSEPRAWDRLAHRAGHVGRTSTAVGHCGVVRSLVALGNLAVSIAHVAKS